MNEHFLSSNGITSQVLPSSINSEEATRFVTKRAKELVSELVKQKGSEEPPFLAEELAPLHGIKRIMKVDDLGELDAVLLKLPEGYVIKVNSNHSPVRQNYSCAHEIGHTFLHEMERHSSMGNAEFRMFSPNIGGKAKEDLCNAAAAELLMPESVFKKYLSRFGVSVSSIEWLARTFRVSIPTTAIRITELSEEPCMAIQWKTWQKAKSKGFWLAWCAGPGRKSRDIGYHLVKSKYVRNPSSLLEAYESNSLVKSYKSFEISHIRKRCYMESKGFGRNNMRYVISLVFPER